MTTNDMSKPENLEKYAFLWSEARLAIAAIALFAGGIPILRLIVRPTTAGGFQFITAVLTGTWIISGLASAYLLYRWLNAKQKVFGGKDQKDTAAFLVSVVSGLNLGLVGLIGRNIGMTIFGSYAVWVLAGIVYLVSAWHLYQRWTASGKKLFS